jgi:signal transduction histidine kinase
VILNLVSNAIKYCDPAKADRTVEIAVSDGGDGVCAIAVRDNGLGIPESDQLAIFDRFFRAHSHLDDEFGVNGTGLGLASSSNAFVNSVRRSRAIRRRASAARLP